MGNGTDIFPGKPVRELNHFKLLDGISRVHGSIMNASVEPRTINQAKISRGRPVRGVPLCALLQAG